MGTVLLATDGSDYARRAADHAVELARARGHDLHVLCVVDENRFDEPALSAAELATIDAEDHAALTVDEVVAVASERGVRATGDTRHGVPHEVIRAVAEELAAELIVVGEHGDHHRHVAGVGQRVANDAPCEVIVVTAGETPTVE